MVRFGGLASCGMLALLLAAPANGLQPPSRGEARLVISAQSPSGRPLSDIAFEVTSPNAAAQVLRTQSTGLAQSSGPVAPAVEVELNESDWQLLRPPAVSRTPSALIYAFVLLPGDLKMLTPEDRRAFGQEPWLRAYYAHRRERLLPAGGDPLTPTAQRLSAFLLGNRVEGGEGAPVLLDDDSTSETATVTCRVVGPQGTAIPGAEVVLTVFEEKWQMVRIHAAERGDAQGGVRFRRVPVPSLARIEASAPGLGPVGGAFLVVDRAGEYNAAPLVLRERERVVSGLVIEADRPVAGAVVRTVPSPSGAVLSTRTDSFGFFSLAPVPTGLRNVQVLAPGTPEALSIQPPGDFAEALIRLDLLYSPSLAQGS